MSYDLYFRQKISNQPFTKREFTEYFASRKYFNVNGDQAIYSNEDSGVYFLFDYMSIDDQEAMESEDGLLNLPVTFNLNYMRPHPFGLEAEPEVAEFVKNVNLTVSDPQTSGMGDGEYSKEGFLRGWNAGNRFGYQVAAKEAPNSFLTLPTPRIEETWQWNRDREKRQEQLGDTRFVPRIMFIDVDREVQTIAVWTDGIPILLPKVDLVVIPRASMAPKKWFRKKEDIVHFHWNELETILRRFPRNPLSVYELYYDSIPADIERLIRNKQPEKGNLKGLPFDQILNRELVEQVKMNC